jgi:uncharacterized protein
LKTNEQSILQVAQDLKLRPNQIQAVSVMVEEGASVPFMARYRKERTGSLDEVQIRAITDGLERIKLCNLRREGMLSSLKERGLETAELTIALNGAKDLKSLEELYYPHRIKRKTKASLAKERGLGPLAEEVLSQGPHHIDPEKLLSKDLNSIECVWSGVRDICAEHIAECLPLRQRLRDLSKDRGLLISKVIKKKADEAIKFKDYFELSTSFKALSPHRLQAILRGQKEGFLRVKLRADEHEAQQTMCSMVIKNHSRHRQQLELACREAYERLLAPSLENELLAEAKAIADQRAIAVFAENLKSVLMAAPLGQKTVIAIDPGFRTGCKAVVLDGQGELLENRTVHPFGSETQIQGAKNWLNKVLEKHQPLAVAVGNGTAGRESEAFLKSLHWNIPIVQVSESGASIYSASEIAREEFPDLDLTVRGAISIGRRLQDPLAEWVKLDPKNMGLGQYQHDVDQKQLKCRLSAVIEDCVHSVGVELNSASATLLSHVSGLGSKLAQAIVDQRRTEGPFPNRAALLKVPRLGAKAFEQSAGFLRLRNSDHPLDLSAVHPERYSIVETMAKDNVMPLELWLNDAQARGAVDLDAYCTKELGLPTLNDIMAELDRPGRDPRSKFEAFSFSDEVNKIEDLHEGQVLPGVITNVTQFGAFVDIGVHQDGLVHISQLADHFVKEPLSVVRPQQKVRVRVLEVDQKRKRISLSMRATTK